jgi:hypothetical protein
VVVVDVVVCPVVVWGAAACCRAWLSFAGAWSTNLSAASLRPTATRNPEIEKRTGPTTVSQTSQPRTRSLRPCAERKRT